MKEKQSVQLRWLAGHTAPPEGQAQPLWVAVGALVDSGRLCQQAATVFSKGVSKDAKLEERLLLAFGGCCWLLAVVGCWLLLAVVGCCWLLAAVGCWLLLVVQFNLI